MGDLDFAGTARFEIKRRVGEGGMGVVYEALDRETGRRVALKTLKQLDAQSLFHFKREFRAVQGLQHRNLISLGELFEADGKWFFTMELVEGCDFLTHVRRGRAPTVPQWASADEPSPSSESDTRPIEPTPARDRIAPQAAPADEVLLRPALRQLAVAVSTLHRHGVIHRDLKPSNIRVVPDGRVVVLDFGVAALAAGTPQGTASRVVGTAKYMAPEQALSGEGRPEADWYSFGVVLYEALTGRLPFVGRTDFEVLSKKQHYAPPPPRALVPGTPADLDQLCTQLITIDPSERPKESEILERLGADVETPTDLASHHSSSSHLTQATPFVGREAQIELLRRAFGDVQRGSARAVAVVGASGLGKTALIRRFVEIVTSEAPGSVVLEGRCYERESVPYKAFDGVVDSLSQYMRGLPEQESAVLVPVNAGLLSRVFPVLGRVECIAQAPRPHGEIKDPQELRARAFTALREMLFLLAERHPLLVVIDDMQWADADSVLLLQELMREGKAPPLLLLMTSRVDATGGPTVATDARAASAPLASIAHESLALGPLDAGTAPELARLLLLRAGVEGGDAASIAGEARGHPMYIDELVRHAAMAGAESPHRLRLDDAIWARVSSLPPSTRRVLELVCVAGARLPQETIAHAAQMSAADLAAHVALLRVANFVRSEGGRASDTIEAYHDRVREAVLANLANDVLVDRHRRVAIALESSRAAELRPELLVRHFEAAGESRKAADLAAEAAHRASTALAFDRAAQLYRSALRLGEHSGAALIELRVLLGDALANAGLGPEAADVFLVAAGEAEPATRLDCERRAAEQLLISGHIERGIETISGVLAAHGARFPRTPRRALVSVLWRRSLLRLRGLGWKERHASEISQRDLSRIDVYRAVSQGLGMVDTIRGADFQVRGLRLALDTGERLRIGRMILQEAIYVGSQGIRRLPRAQALVERARQVAEDSGDAFLKAWVVGGDGILAYFAGRFRDAVGLCAKSEEMFRDTTTGTWWEISTISVFRLYALVRMGVFREIGEARERFLRDAAFRGDRYAETTIRRFSSSFWLAKHRPEEGLDELERMHWPLPEKSYHLQHWYELSARGEIALYRRNVAELMAGFRDDFRRLQRSLLLRIEIVRAVAQWLRGRLALSVAQSDDDPEPSLATASRAARQLERERLPSVVAWAKLLRAGCAHLRGDEQTAVDELREAANHADEHDMPFYAAVARRRLGSIVGGDQGAALIADADSWMANEGIEDPDRMSEVVAPGFAR